MSADFRLPISPESPGGQNTTVSHEVLEIRSLLQGTAETQFNPAQDPDWSLLEKRASAFLAKSKNLEVFVAYAVTLLKRRGLEGLAEGLELVSINVKNFWPDISPRLDPEYDNDPDERLLLLGALSGPEGAEGDAVKYLKRLKETVLYQFPVLGKVTLSALQQRKEAGVLDFQTALKAERPEALRAPLEWARRAQQALLEMVEFLNSAVTPAKAPKFETLSEAVAAIVGFFEAGQTVSEEEAAPEAVTAQAGAAGTRPPGAAGAGFHTIRSRQEVLKALDAVCKYYEWYEPASPLPLLLKRCIELVPKSFLEVVKELLPDGVSQLKKLGGIPE
jgi:type VI secretion system protein ImpA